MFRDKRGAVIPYGRRWAAQNRDGPDETYSIRAHPERFAPLINVAHAIIEHLTTTYDLRREDVHEVEGSTRGRRAGHWRQQREHAGS